jgi:hypothetical protein
LLVLETSAADSTVDRQGNHQRAGNYPQPPTQLTIGLSGYTSGPLALLCGNTELTRNHVAAVPYSADRYADTTSRSARKTRHFREACQLPDHHTNQGCIFLSLRTSLAWNP